MKEHILAKLINDLRDISIRYHAHGCLRELIKVRVNQALDEDKKWKAEHGDIKKRSYRHRSRLKKGLIQRKGIASGAEEVQTAGVLRAQQGEAPVEPPDSN